VDELIKKRTPGMARASGTFKVKAVTRGRKDSTCRPTGGQIMKLKAPEVGVALQALEGKNPARALKKKSRTGSRSPPLRGPPGVRPRAGPSPPESVTEILHHQHEVDDLDA